MRLFLIILLYVFIGLLSYSQLSGCTTINIGKIKPEYEGVEPRVEKLVNEYKELAKLNGINFTKIVTIGFKKIKQEYVVGLTTYGNNFREIDLDQKYWSGATSMNKLALVFHELTHAYCYREHDWGTPSIAYPQNEEDREKEYKKRIGYHEDGCSLSIMHPIIVSDKCMKEHYSEYIKEMFQRCIPY